MNGFLLWRHARPIFYMASIAATWIWAPAIFVSSEKAHYGGLSELLMFLVPNVLTLVLFAFFARKVRRRSDGFTLTDAVKGRGQRRLHLGISLVVLICSTCVQLLGLHTLFSAWGEIPKWQTAAAMSLLAFAMVGRSGLRGSIRTDFAKYAVMLLGGMFLLASMDGEMNLEGVRPANLWEQFSTFGLPTMIGLMCAPYVDQTFWQRVFSIDEDKIIGTFLGSAALFALIPGLFGLIGLCGAGEGWNIAAAFQGLHGKVLALCVLCALLSTLDSNLCAIASIACADFGRSVAEGRAAMAALLACGSALMACTDISITGLFLIYGTIRTCAAVPTMLIILGRYDERRLLYATCAAAAIAPAGYILTGSAAFTVLAFALPLLGGAKGDNV